MVLIWATKGCKIQCICTSNSSFPKEQDNECYFCYSKEWANNEVPLYRCRSWKQKPNQQKQTNKKKRYLVTTDQVNVKETRQDKFVLFWSSYSTQDYQKTTTPLKRKTFGVTHATCSIPLCYDHSHLCPLWEWSQHLDKYSLLHVKSLISILFTSF